MNLVTVLSYVVAVTYIAVLAYIMFVWNKEDRQ